MSQFTANTGDIGDGASRLGSMSSEIAELHGQLGGHYSAGAGTSISGQLDDVMDTWNAVLPQFGAAGDGLQSALLGAASNYASADGVTADAANAAEAPGGVQPA
jgi:hypothetical protein